MFGGHYEHTIDAKGRTSLPARFRHVLPAAGDLRLVMAPALRDPCLDVYPMAGWKELEERVARLPRWDRDLVLFRRRYLSAAVECEIDRHGRVALPQSLRRPAALEREVVWAGVGDKMELWSRERWYAALELPEAELDRWTAAIAEKLDA
jgi:MraZ protein